jgi:hypothetical protein
MLHDTIKSRLPKEAMSKGEETDNPIFGWQAIKFLVDRQKGQGADAKT